MAFPTFVGDSVTVDSNGGAVAASTPSGTPTTGDLLKAVCVSYDNNTATWTPPAGWTQLGSTVSVSQAGLLWRFATFYKIHDGSETYTFTEDQGTYSTVYIQAWRDTDQTTPMDTTQFSSNQGSGSTTVTGTGVTVANNDSVLLWNMIGYGTGLSSGPSGFDAREVNYDGVSNAYSDDVASGATGDKTGTLSTSDVWSCHMSVINPVLGGDTPTVSSTSPSDDATNVAVDTTLSITFNQNIQAGTGSFDLYETVGDVLVESFDVATDVSIVSATASFTPSSSLDNSKSYYVLADNGVVEAADDSEPWGGIASSTAWNFTTEAVPGAHTPPITPVTAATFSRF